MKNLLRSKKVLLGVVGLAAAALLVACGGSGDTNEVANDPVLETEHKQALGLFDKLPVSWAPSPLVFTLNPGSVQTVPVTLTTKKALTNSKIVFVPDLRNAVTVTPEVIPTLAAGQSATVTLTFAPKATDTRKLIAGVVLLFDKNATVSQPLPVKVSLVKAETINGVVVPPEPPADLNNATLAGFDTNGNGVRDDVERRIAGAALKLGTKVSTVRSFAKAEQLLLSSPSEEVRDAYMQFIVCMVDNDQATAADVDPFTYSLLNTPQRNEAYSLILAGATTEGCN